MIWVFVWSLSVLSLLALLVVLMIAMVLDEWRWERRGRK